MHSDNGREFVNSIITNLNEMWSDVKIVHGKPRHSQSQGSVERANRDIEAILAAWMTDNNSKDWPTALKFIQFQKKSSIQFRLVIFYYYYLINYQHNKFIQKKYLF